MTDFERRLRDDLEPILGSPDPREKLSAYHDMPYALFRYDPEQEYRCGGKSRCCRRVWPKNVTKKPSRVSWERCGVHRCPEPTSSTRP